ncbi:MAG: DUF2177 family protein [Proteobacteria bacterium]|nr:DUF2177 family protein [Pseudomonadota bacterium]
MAAMMRIGVPWIAGLVGLVLLDLLWIGFVASGIYRSQIGHLLNIVDGQMVVNVPAAVATWAVIVTGVQLFVLPRVSGSGSIPLLMLWGALFGVIVYAVYDLTNYAVIKNWPLTVTIVDIVWGAVVCSMTALCMGLASRAMGRFL